MAQSGSVDTYRPDLDGLRAVAVLSVVLCHAELGLSGGFVGVDVFFVLSGFLITRLMRNEASAGTFSLLSFWERRLRRIAPALVVVTTASLVAGWFLLLPTAYRDFGSSVEQLLLVQANRHFVGRIDYFAPAAETTPLLHTWSLAVEEQFYLFIPLLFWVAARRGWNVRLGFILAALMILSFIASCKGVRVNRDHAYYLLVDRAWELLAGACLAYIPWRNFAFGPQIHDMAALFGLSCIILPCLTYDSTTPFPGRAALPPVLGTALLIALGEGATSPTIVHRWLASLPMRGIGLISYSFYLWHWPILVFYRLYAYDAPPSPTAHLLCVSISLVVAAVSFRYVEQPVRRREFLAARPRLFAAASAAFVGLMIAARLLVASDGVVQRIPPQVQRLVETAGGNRFMLRGPGGKKIPERHQLGEETHPQLLVWGDSHALCILPAIEQLCRTHGISARAAARLGCPPLAEYHGRIKDREVADANAFSKSVFEELNTEGIHHVLLAARWSKYSTDPSFGDALLATIEALQSAGCRVYFLKEVPCFADDVVMKLTRMAWDDRDLSALSLSLEAHAAFNQNSERLAPQMLDRNVVLLDPVAVLQVRSGSNRLRPCDSEGTYYFDGDHLSAYGAFALAPVFTPIFDMIAADDRRIPSSPADGTRPIVVAESVPPASTSRR